MNPDTVARNVIAFVIVAATIVMMLYQIPIPDAWWTVAVAVIAFLFPRPNTNGPAARTGP
jgi:hypothetical protein